MKRLTIAMLLLFAIALYFEYRYKVDQHYEEKSYDLQLQYNYVLKTYQHLIDIFMHDVIHDPEVLRIISDANRGVGKNANRDLLYIKYRDYYEQLKSKGILQFHFHLADGESYLRFHKPEKFGDNILAIRPTIQEVHLHHRAIHAYEIGRLYDGFRYVYPIMEEERLIGTVECSVGPKAVLDMMRSVLDASYSMILKKSMLETKIVAEGQLERHFHASLLSDAYMMRHDIHDESILPSSVAKRLQLKTAPKLLEGKASAVSAIKSFDAVQMLVFVPVNNIHGQNVGYYISSRSDTMVMQILYEQIAKFIVLGLALCLILYLYRKGRRTGYLLEQYKEAVDQSTLVSKTDPNGIITYVNDSFEKLSGYSKNELMGEPHSIVRASSMSPATFKGMWKTIQSGQIWRGKITNRAKNGSLYTVQATIIPITDPHGKIQEYIAIRHDVTELEELRKLLEGQLDSSIKSLDEKMHLLQQYETAIDNASMLLRTDANGVITYVNNTYERISGFAKEELIGSRFEALRAPMVPGSFFKDLWQTVKRKKIWKNVIENVGKSGKPFYIDSTIVPILNSDDSIREFMAIHHDVTAIYELQQEIIDTQREVVYTMGAIGESRSKETGNHVKRVAKYSYLLARHYGLEEEEAELLKQASPMHDIGKVGIPDAILNKPGKLDKEEWEVMMTHADLGYQMLQHSERPILKAAAIVAREHHEKWDGSGYPTGLSGEEIHIYGRITAVADVFDALGSDRVYKAKWEDEKIFGLFREERGKHFDPKLVDIFFEHLDEFLAVREELKDV